MASVPIIVCAGEDRRNAVAAAGGALNGLDFVEVVPGAVPGSPPTLAVRFLFDVSGAGLGPTQFAIAGGERITAVRVVSVAPGATALDLVLSVDIEGDFSQYALVLQLPGQPDLPPPGFDPQLRLVAFRFHIACRARFDCKPPPPIAAAAPAPVSIDYLARDYTTFRRLMLDRMALLAPDWSERNVADAGVAIVEAIAYAADRLSYRQDAQATEAYLATARLRSSVRRHVRLVDYDMHDGCNARAWLRVRVTVPVGGSAAAPAIPAGTRVLTGLPTGGTLLAESVETFRLAAQVGAQVFETMAPVINLSDDHNEMPFYAWRARNCCLPAGTLAATLVGAHPALRPGDVLVLAEIRGPVTGNREDADPGRRHPVRLLAAAVGADPLDGTPITEIAWHADDALPFDLCLAHTVGSDAAQVVYDGISAAWGNIVLCDHGRSVGAPIETLPIAMATAPAGRRFRPAMPLPGVIYAGPSPYGAGGVLAGSAVAATMTDPRTALPAALSVVSTRTIPAALGGPPELQTTGWTAVRSLFDPAVADSPAAFVVEVESDGAAYLRFGDGVDGTQPEAGAVFAAASFRIGDMVSGNVGADTLVHILVNRPAIAAVTNPLPALGGQDPEGKDSAKLNAPYAFRTQERAVTLDDYARVAMACPSVRVLRAVATNRVTRSWRTVLLSVQLADGRLLDATVRGALLSWLDIRRMAGVDVEVEAARLVPLELGLHVCVDPSFRRDEVQQVLLRRFSDGILEDGTPGVFYPDNLLLGGTIYLGPLVAAAQAVTGVTSVDVITFQRADLPGPTGPVQGYLKPGRTEVFTLRNNPDFPEQGSFTLQMDGGR